MDALAKIKYFLLVLLIFTLPLGVLSRIDLGNAVAITINDILVGLLFGFYILSFILKRKIKGKLLTPILIFACALVLSLVINYKRLNFDEITVSFLYLLRWVAYSSIYLAVLELGALQKNKVLKYLAVSGLVTVVFGFLQLLLYPNLKNLFYAGWDEHLYRLFGTFLDPNFSGLIFTLLFFLILLIKPAIFKNTRLKWLTLIIIFISIILTFSRSSVIAFVSSLAVYTFLLKDKVMLYGLLLAVICLAIFYLIIPKQESTNVFRSASVLARVDSYQEGFKIFANNPVFGIGFNSYRYALEDYGFKDKMKFGPSHGASGNDNSFLFVLATSGIIGFSAFFYLFYKIFKTENSNPILRNLTLLSVFVGSLFVNALFFVFIIQWIWIILGATEKT